MVVSSFDQVSYEVKNLKNTGLLIVELDCSKKGFFVGLTFLKVCLIGLKDAFLYSFGLISLKKTF